MSRPELLTLAVLPFGHHSPDPDDAFQRNFSRFSYTYERCWILVQLQWRRWLLATASAGSGWACNSARPGNTHFPHRGIVIDLAPEAGAFSREVS